jgi:hypothetical protein
LRLFALLACCWLLCLIACVFFTVAVLHFA